MVVGRGLCVGEGERRLWIVAVLRPIGIKDLLVLKVNFVISLN